MSLLKTLSHISHITEKIYFGKVDNIKKDVHGLRGYVLYMLSAQKAYKDDEEHDSEE